MIHPSGVQRHEDLSLEIKEIQKSIFVVGNAYAGDYEYFPGQVLIKDVGNPQEITETDAEKLDDNNEQNQP